MADINFFRPIFRYCLLLGLGLFFQGQGVAAEILSQAERGWLQAHPDIRVVVLPDYPPISFLDAQGKPVGLEQDYLDLLEQRLNVRFKKVIPTLAQRAANSPSEKQADMLTLFALTPERSKHWLFSKPYLDFPIYLITPEKAPIGFSLENAGQLRISAVEHYATYDYLKTRYPNVHIEAVGDTCLGLQHVAFGVSAGLLTDLPVANWCAEHLGLKHLKIAQSIDFRYQMGLAVRNDWAPLMAILEKGLATITPAERDAIYARWSRNAFEDSIFETYRHAFFALALGLLGLAIYQLMQWDKVLKLALDTRVQHRALNGRQPKPAAMASKTLVQSNITAFAVIITVLCGVFALAYVQYAKASPVLFNSIAVLLLSIGLFSGFIFGKLLSRYDADSYLNQLLKAIDERQEFGQKLSLSEARLAKQQAALGQLAQRQLQSWLTPDEIFREIAEVSAKTLNVERVSVWLFSDDREQLECMCLYLKSSQLHTVARPLQLGDFPCYFEQLKQHRVIAAHDAVRHAATSEFTACYLQPNQIGAMLDSTIWLDNQVIGVICHEHIGGVREWALDEQNFAGSVADLARLTVETHQRRLAETALRKYSETLVQMVDAKTLSLQASEQRLSYVIAHAPIPILSINISNGEIAEFNPEAELATGYMRQDVVGQSFIGLLVADESQDMMLSMTGRLRKGEDVRNIEIWLNHATGKKVEFLFSACLMAHDNGAEADFVVAIGQDITQQKLLQASLVQAREAAESADRIKSMFVASMSHELRTPLNSIIGFLGVVLHGMSGEVNDKQKDQLGRAYKSAKHLLALISDVIDISKIEAGYLNVYVESFPLKPLLAECIQTVQAAADAKHLAIRLACTEGLAVASDRKRLYQVFLNVVSNAVKYTEQGFVDISVQIEQDKVKIIFQDSGIGIDAEGLAKLFTPFERAESHLKIKTLGTGLGLYLTRKILTQLLAGDITVTSKVGEGSVFTVEIPKQLLAQNIQTSLLTP